ncbi:hypothetical protein QFC21_003447 [Naganishia friedmannii]|uniref:Uncharacterized protein n=1 Tax=Naganishia friedmannii TaxID=89922 RepID=A0ACC2VPA2_9TREE|nr:hypothetical protein QFC21_003447 [Naganishia friedmannii]
MLRKRSISRDQAQVSKSDSKRQLLSPLFTQFSSPETRYTQSPGSMDYHSSQPRMQDDGMEARNRPKSEESERERDRYGPQEQGQDDQQLADLAKGLGGIEHHLEAKKQSEFMQHANRSLHSLLSRHSTILEHGGTDSGPPTSTNPYLPGHILAPRPGSSADDYTDLETLKPLPNAHDEYVAHQRNNFPNSKDQAKENTEIIAKMHHWMDGISELQEEIAGMHMQLEGVDTETEGDHEYELSEKLEDKTLLDDGQTEQGRVQGNGSGNGNENRNRGAEAKDKKREDGIMDEMIQKLHNLSKKLQDFHATPHPTINFRSAREPDSRTNAVPDAPKPGGVDVGEKEQDEIADDGRKDDEADDRQPSKNIHLKTVSENVRGTSTGISADPEHPKEFLRPRQHRDFARETAPTPPQQSSKSAREHEGDQQRFHEAMDSSRVAALATQTRLATRSKPPTTEPADLRRKVLQSYDRARWGSVDAYSPITPVDGGGATGDGRRPNLVRGWSTVLES